MAAKAIWRGYECDLSEYITDDKVDYKVVYPATTTSETDITIYEGTAYANPDGTCIVQLRDICADWLRHPAPFPTGADKGSIHAFAVYIGEEEVDNVTFINDWSYDVDMAEAYEDPARVTLNAPISTDFIPGMVVPSAEFRINNAILTYRDIEYEDFTDSVGIKHHAVDLCDPWCIYYINKYGAWDALVLKGGVVESETYTRKRYDTLEGVVEYRNEVRRKWVCRTGWLSRDAGLRIAHLIGTVKAYLYNPAREYDVVIDDSSVQALNLKKNGRQVVEYTFTVMEALMEERR